jgi:acetyltransferase-like isoleucine patch superfamily enzyme
MFQPSPFLRVAILVARIVLFPFALPFVLLAKLVPNTGFRMASEMLSVVPFAFGEILRYDFYRCTLRRCGKNVFISFGTVFMYSQIEIGHDVLIGLYNTVHHCDFDSYVMTAEGCRFLSGSHYHSFGGENTPMMLQGGEMKRIHIGRDVWIGANAVVMEDVEEGSVVGAGSVVTKTVEPYSIVAGNPARLIGSRSVKEEDDLAF